MSNDFVLNRRNFLAAAGAGVAVGMAGPSVAAIDKGDKLPLVIDCHAHIYGTDDSKYPTIAEPYRPPEGKGTVQHLKQEMKDAGVSHVTAIHSPRPVALLSAPLIVRSAEDVKADIQDVTLFLGQ